MNFSIPAFACASALLVVLPAAGQDHAAKALMQSADGKDLGIVTFEQTKSGMLRIFKEHGFNAEKGPHIGDLPNVHVAADGILKVEFFTDRLTLDEGAENSLRKPDGAAVVVHADADDYGAEESGHAGSRIACGVIE